MVSVAVSGSTRVVASPATVNFVVLFGFLAQPLTASDPTHTQIIHTVTNESFMFYLQF
jgi:hypothetical protein